MRLRLPDGLGDRPKLWEDEMFLSEEKLVQLEAEVVGLEWLRD